MATWLVVALVVVLAAAFAWRWNQRRLDRRAAALGFRIEAALNDDDPEAAQRALDEMPLRLFARLPGEKQARLKLRLRFLQAKHGARRCATTGDHEGAAKHLGQAIQLAPQVHEDASRFEAALARELLLSRLALARSLAELGRADEALSSLSKALASPTPPRERKRAIEEEARRWEALFHKAAERGTPELGATAMAALTRLGRNPAPLSAQLGGLQALAAGDRANDAGDLRKARDLYRQAAEKGAEADATRRLDRLGAEVQAALDEALLTKRWASVLRLGPLLRELRPESRGRADTAERTARFEVQAQEARKRLEAGDLEAALRSFDAALAIPGVPADRRVAVQKERELSAEVVERRRSIRADLEKANALAEAGDLAQAIVILENASQRASGTYSKSVLARLDELRRLRAEHLAERRRPGAVLEQLRRAREAQKQRAEAARAERRQAAIETYRKQLRGFCRYRELPVSRALRIYDGLIRAGVQPANAAQTIERWFRDYAKSGTEVVEREVQRALAAGLRSHKLTYEVGLELAKIERQRRREERLRELQRRRQNRRGR